MIVYRLEDKAGKGPFSSAKRWPAKGRNDRSAVHTKLGCTVEYSGFLHHYRFATESLASLEKYWGKRLKYFLDDGWVIGVYRVRRNFVTFGRDGVELAFKADKAVKL